MIPIWLFELRVFLGVVCSDTLNIYIQNRKGGIRLIAVQE